MQQHTRVSFTEGRTPCWQPWSDTAEPKAWLKGKVGLNWGSCRQQMHLQPGKSQPGSASSSTAALHQRPNTGRHLVPLLLTQPEKGLAVDVDAAKGKRIKRGRKRLKVPFSCPGEASPAGWAGLEELVKRQVPVSRSWQPASHPAAKPGWRELGKLGWRESSCTTKALFLCAKCSVPSWSKWNQLRRLRGPWKAICLLLLLFSPLPCVSAWEIHHDYLPAAPSPSLPLSPGSIANKSPRWERGPEETRGAKPQTEPFFPCSALPSSSAFH